MKKNALFILLFLSFSCATVFSQTALHIYGGEDHDVYLGCINCDKYNTNSIWNEYGDYGSKYNSKSIWNSYGKYGGQYSQFSPFNSYTGTPPIIVDKDGNSYGYLTTNKYKSERTNLKLALLICNNWEQIKDDVSAWYDKIFK